jgi:solute carrier family 45, member 1/2/4
VDGDDSALEAEGTRLGSRALFFQSVTALASNILLPFFVRDDQGKQRDGPSFFEVKTRSILDKFKVHLTTLWAASHLLFFLCMEATW